MIYDELKNESNEKDDIYIDIEDILDSKISYNSQTMDIETVLLGLSRGDYKLPLYQRKYVWELSDASNLILSLIKNIPIPPIYLYLDSNSGQYVILDGQQRISTLFMYYNNIFYVNKKERKRLDFEDISKMLEFKEEVKKKLKEYRDLYSKDEIVKMEERIHEIEEKLLNNYNLKGKSFVVNDEDITFENFNEKAKRVLKRKSIEVVFVQCKGKNPLKAYTEIFKLVNSAGKPLSAQEIRNGIYYDSKLYNAINIINENNTVWRNIYGNSLISKDFEYLLRFLALDYYSEYDEYSDKIFIKNDITFTLANIIDQYSDEFSKDDISIEKIESQVIKLRQFFGKFKDIINEKNSVPGGKILIIEALFIAMSKLNLLDKDIDISYYKFVDKLDLGKDFGVDKSTSSKANTIKRIEKAIGIIKKEYKIC